MPVMALFTAMPMWVKVGAGMGLLMGLMQLTHWWNTRDLKRDLARQEQALKATQEEAAKAAATAQQQLEREAANREAQQAAIDRQNAQITNISARARQAESTAALAALRVSEEGRLIADALRDKSTTVPVGYEAMNAWQEQRFREVTK